MMHVTAITRTVGGKARPAICKPNYGPTVDRNTLLPTVGKSTFSPFGFGVNVQRVGMLRCELACVAATCAAQAFALLSIPNAASKLAHMLWVAPPNGYVAGVPTSC
eukprot:602916-Amphidinium_carterae.1